jgi:DNA-binding beta-propeller fold protein YncE
MRLFYLIIIWFYMSSVVWCQPVPRQDLSIDSSFTSIPLGKWFQDPVAISVDPLGRIYILDRGRNTLQKITIKDTTITAGESHSWRDNAINQFQDIISPNGLDIYVADYGSNRIHRFDRDLNFISSIPQTDVQASMEKVFGFPSSIAIDRFGSLYVIDKEDKNICKIGASDRIDRTFGGHDAGLGRLIEPHTIRISNKNELIYVSDLNRIVVFDIYGNYITTKPIPGPGKPFTVDGGFFMMAESCTVSVIDNEGIIRGNIAPPVLRTGRICDRIIDIEINQGVLYLLTKQYLILVGIRYRLYNGD